MIRKHHWHHQVHCVKSFTLNQDVLIPTLLPMQCFSASKNRQIPPLAQAKGAGSNYASKPTPRWGPVPEAAAQAQSCIPTMPCGHRQLIDHAIKRWWGLPGREHLSLVTLDLSASEKCRGAIGPCQRLLYSLRVLQPSPTRQQHAVFH